MVSQSTSQETMFRFIDQWKLSGQNQLAFCREHQIVYHSFHYWYKRYKQSRNSASAPAGFIELKPSYPQAGVFAELIYSNGNKIVLNQPVAVDFLKALVS
jgi:hypothetical protein